MRNPEIDNFKVIIQPYYNKHKQKFNNFSVCVMWKTNDMLENKIYVPSTITLQKPHFFKPIMIELPIKVRVTSLDFLDTFDRNINDKVYETDIMFISDFKAMTFPH